MEDKNVSTCYKRKDVNDDVDEDPTVLKKARYSWQIKSTCSNTPTNTDNRTLVIEDLDDLSITLNSSNHTENLENKDKINSQLKLNINESITSDKISVDQEYLDKKDRFTGSSKACQKLGDNSTVPSTSELQTSKVENSVTCPIDISIGNFTKGDKKDLSVYLSELENENLHRPSVYPSHLDINLTSTSTSGQRSEDIFNSSSDSEAEEEGLLFSSPQRCTNSLDFDVHLARWQNQHAAKAIVDNAINKTLEEMGVSPEEDLDEFAADKYYVEDEGISEAIRRQGLICQHEDQRAYVRQENSYSSVEEQSSVDEPQYSEDVVNHQDRERSNLGLTETRPQTNLHKNHEAPRTELHQNLIISQNANLLSQHGSGEELYAKSCSSSESVTVSATSSYHNDRCVPVSNNDLIDQAVTMAICSQGLALPNNVS